MPEEEPLLDYFRQYILDVSSVKRSEYITNYAIPAGVLDPEVPYYRTYLGERR